MALYAKYPTKSVKKYPNDVIKTDKKKTRTAKQKESYGIYNYKVLIKAHPVSRIDINSTFMIGSLFDKINTSTYLFELCHLLKCESNIVFNLNFDL